MHRKHLSVFLVLPSLLLAGCEEKLSIRALEEGWRRQLEYEEQTSRDQRLVSDAFNDYLARNGDFEMMYTALIYCGESDLLEKDPLAKAYAHVSHALQPLIRQRLQDRDPFVRPSPTATEKERDLALGGYETGLTTKTIELSANGYITGIVEYYRRGLVQGYAMADAERRVCVNSFAHKDQVFRMLNAGISTTQ